MVNKANSILGIIKRNFRYLSQEYFIMLYKALVRSHSEYVNTIWSPYKKCDIHVLEGAQRRATKLIRSIKHLPYENRLKIRITYTKIPLSKLEVILLKFSRLCMVITIILI